MKIKKSWIIWYKHVLSHLVFTEDGRYLVHTDNGYESIYADYAKELIEKINE